MPNASRMYTIVVASGSSQRYGANKLDELIGTETILNRSVRVAKESSDGVVVVIEPAIYRGPEVDCVVSGGENRSESVKQGLSAVPSDIEIIAIHDAARPGVTKEIYDRGREIIESGKVAAIPAVDVVDTIKRVDSVTYDTVKGTVNRSTLRAVQTPQIFTAEVIRAAHVGQTYDTDDAALVERLGHEVVIFQGSEQSRKVTTPSDLILLKEILGEKSYPLPDRIGTGYDIHPFGRDRSKKLVLGGVEFDHVGLVGHSDSDAVAHALTDALLSAIGGPDLGTLFPASDQANKGASSMDFLHNVVTGVHNEGYFLVNASIIVNAQKPKLADKRDEMVKLLAEVMSPIMYEHSIISLTPKHGEGIGEIGLGQAIAVYATVQLTPAPN